MKPQDVALLVLVAVALVIAASVFGYRRRRGSSRAVAVFAAGMSAGAVVASAFLLFYYEFMPRRASIGLERIVTPILVMFASTVGSAVLAGVVYVLGTRNPATDGTPVALDAEASLRKAGRAPSDRSGDGIAWREFARQAAQDSRAG
jgi:hypothetical protein